VNFINSTVKQLQKDNSAIQLKSVLPKFSSIIMKQVQLIYKQPYRR